MRSKKVLLFAVAAAFAVAAVPVAAQKPLSGTYGFTGEAICLVSTGGFNANLTPKTGSVVYVQSFTSNGSVTFVPNGTGTGGTATGSSTDININHTGGSVGSPSPSGSSVDFSLSLTYTQSGNLLTVQQGVSGTTVGTPITGPDAGSGHIYSVDLPPVTGRIGKGSGPLVLTSADATVEDFKIMDSTGTVIATHPRICHRTRVFVP